MDVIVPVQPTITRGDGAILDRIDRPRDSRRQHRGATRPASVPRDRQTVRRAAAPQAKPIVPRDPQTVRRGAAPQARPIAPPRPTAAPPFQPPPISHGHAAVPLERTLDRMMREDQAATTLRTQVMKATALDPTRLSIAELRVAVILSEILRPPVALRSESSGVFLP